MFRGLPEQSRQGIGDRDDSLPAWADAAGPVPGGALRVCNARIERHDSGRSVSLSCTLAGEREGEAANLQRWILALADDLTGALEVGARFAECRVRAQVTTALSLDSAPESDVLVINTESRHLSALDAAAVVRSVAGTARPHQPSLIYKKTDSTLRGNIAAELRALLDVWPERRVLYAGAYPALGRTVRAGQLLVRGVPVHQTEFAADLLNPITTSDIRTVLGSVPATIRDGESDGDLRAAAGDILAEEGDQIAAGPAALAGALAELIGDRGEVRPLPRLNRILVVNGSRHPASEAQTAYAREQGFFTDQWTWFDDEVTGEGTARALRAGERVRQRLQSSRFEALIVFGGDTASGIHRAFGAPPFEPICEVVPGVPISHCAGLYWITKAGGFGAPDILDEIRKRLS